MRCRCAAWNADANVVSSRHPHGLGRERGCKRTVCHVHLDLVVLWLYVGNQSVVQGVLAGCLHVLVVHERFEVLL